LPGELPSPWTFCARRKVETIPPPSSMSYGRVSMETIDRNSRN
jgi:hypothetical protein